MTKEKNKKKSLRSLVTTCFFILILAGSFLFGKDSLAVPNNYNKNATSTLIAAEWNNLIVDFVNTWQATSMVGPLGIGTTAPGTKFEISEPTRTITGNVSGDAQVNLALMASDAAAIDKGGAIGFGGQYLSGNSTNILFGAISGRRSNGLSGNADGYLSFYTWNGGVGLSEKMRIGSTGNIGIGTTAPNDIFSIGNSGAAPVGSSNTGHNFTSTYLSADDYALTNYGLIKTLIASATSSITFWGGAASSSIWNLNSGNTGIGTTTPLFKFEVNGTFKVSTSSSSIILDSGGNVLIGI